MTIETTVGNNAATVSQFITAVGRPIAGSPPWHRPEVRDAAGSRSKK